MDKDTKFIIALLVVILILAGIFTWIVLKPKKETNYANNNETYVESDKYDKKDKEWEEIERQQKREENLLVYGTYAIQIICFIIQGFAIYKIAQQEEVEHTWLAFVPYAQWYLIAKIAFDGDAFLGIMYCLGGIINNFVWSNNILSRIVTIIGLYILHRLFKNYRDIAKYSIWSLEIYTIFVGLITILLVAPIFGGLRSSTGTVVIMGATYLVQPLYLYRFSKKVTGEI